MRALREAGVRNPVLMIDGVDRLVGEGGLGVVEVLLELLDPESSAHFTDHYLGLPIDLSHAVLLLCANNLDLVPDALQERLEVIEVPGYSEDEKLEIARRFLVPRQLARPRPRRARPDVPDETLRDDGAPLHARGRRARPVAPDRDRVPQGGARARHRRRAPPRA